MLLTRTLRVLNEYDITTPDTSVTTDVNVDDTTSDVSVDIQVDNEVVESIEEDVHAIQQLANLKQHIERYGVDKTIAHLLNRNGELDALLKQRKVAALEGFPIMGNPRDEISIVCLEGIVDSIANFFKNIISKIASVGSNIVGFIKQLFGLERDAVKVLRSLAPKLANATLNKEKLEKNASVQTYRYQRAFNYVVELFDQLDKAIPSVNTALAMAIESIKKGKVISPAEIYQRIDKSFYEVDWKKTMTKLLAQLLESKGSITEHFSDLEPSTVLKGIEDYADTVNKSVAMDNAIKLEFNYQPAQLEQYILSQVSNADEKVIADNLNVLTNAVLWPVKMYLVDISDTRKKIIDIYIDVVKTYIKYAI